MKLKLHRFNNLRLRVSKLRKSEKSQKFANLDSTEFYKVSEDELGTGNEILKIYEKYRLYPKSPIKRLFVKCKSKLRFIKNESLFFLNIFNEWLSYTFCCIMTGRKKQKGALKSVRI